MTKIDESREAECRAAFEQWQASNGSSPTMAANGRYVWDDANDNWRVWQACWSARDGHGDVVGALNDLIYDGYSVYSALSDKARQRTSADNVSDVLDALSALTKNNPINQCDGCRVGLPVENGIHRGESYGAIACTAHRYQPSDDSRQVVREYCCCGECTQYEKFVDVVPMADYQKLLKGSDDSRRGDAVAGHACRESDRAMVATPAGQELIGKAVQHLKSEAAHKFFGAGEIDCPKEIKASNGELHTLRCRICGLDNPKSTVCYGDSSNANTSAAEKSEPLAWLIDMAKGGKVVVFAEPHSDDLTPSATVTPLYAAPRGADASPKITADEMAAFNRFCDTCEDCDAGGYDVPKSKMQRLARIGLVRWCGGSRYETTEFGDSIRDAAISGQGG